MPISFALLLCIPIGFLFFFIARFAWRFGIGRYDRFEYRASLAFGVFGVLLIPDIWTLGCLQEEFPRCPGKVVSFLLFAVEALILAAVFRLFRKSNMDARELNEKSGS